MAQQQAIGEAVVVNPDGVDANVVPPFRFSEEWQLLGPFQIGTREAAWGADPLELHGGFRSLEYSEHATFKSSLAPNATLSWTTTKAKLSPPYQGQEVSADLSVDFANIDWRSLQDVYGWPALQWQAWARGEINLQGSTTTLALHTQGILEFWLDEKHYFGGDMYEYGRAAVSFHLPPGKHRLDVRLVREARAHGAVGAPTVGAKLRLQGLGPLVLPVLPDSRDPYAGVLISDVVGGSSGPFASPYASVTLRNDAEQDAYVYSMQATHNQCEAELLGPLPIKLLAGQTRPISFRIACVPPATGRGPVRLFFNYRIDGNPTNRAVYMQAWPKARNLHEPQKVTFMHPGGMVSYAVLRPPSPNAHCEKGAKAPVLLALHGAGLEADDDLVRHALDELPDICAWVLFPTGVTPWSGDDWHTWGFADVEAAVAAIPRWIETVEWTGPGVDVDRWLVMGHSNGGQGAWYTLTHRPDKVIAAAPLSGYSSIQNYVPYTLWRTAEPGRVAVIQSALNSYRHELLLENAKDIPTYQQHGTADDNVPAFHSRLLNMLIQQAGAVSEYFELPGMPHWWTGIMTTDPLKHFIRRQLNTGGPAMDDSVPVNARDFALVSAGQGDQGPKNGLEILQVATPGQLGKIHLTFDLLTLACVVGTSNVLSFRLTPLYKDCSFVAVDGVEVTEAITSSEASTTLTKHEGKWTSARSLSAFPPRQGRQLGTIDAILRTKGAFQITYISAAAKHVALQISRNLCQYYAADTVITNDYEEAKVTAGANLITVAIGADLPSDTSGLGLPISLHSDHLEVQDIGGALRAYPLKNGLGAIYLRPLLDERAELIVWGADEEGLDIAARLVPLMTGTGQPDFVVADSTMLWKGVEGTLAMGYFDAWWNVSRNSFFS